MSESTGKRLLGVRRLDKFISIHVHKCGGTTLAYIFQDIYGDKFFWDKSEDSMDIHGRSRHYNMKKVAKSNVIHGHIHVDKYRQLDRPYITWIRNPISRLESEYSVIKQKRLTARSSPLHREIILGELDFESYCKKHRNVFRNYFGEMQPQDFAFIGFLEYYELSLFVLSKLIGYDIPPYYRRNTRILKRQWFKEGTAQDKNMCRHLNREDVVFYAKARKWFVNEFKDYLSLYESGLCAPQIKR